MCHNHFIKDPLGQEKSGKVSTVTFVWARAEHCRPLGLLMSRSPEIYKTRLINYNVTAVVYYIMRHFRGFGDGIFMFDV